MDSEHKERLKQLADKEKRYQKAFEAGLSDMFHREEFFNKAFFKDGFYWLAKPYIDECRKHNIECAAKCRSSTWGQMTIGKAQYHANLHVANLGKYPDGRDVLQVWSQGIDRRFYKKKKVLDYKVIGWLTAVGVDESLNLYPDFAVDKSRIDIMETIIEHSLSVFFKAYLDSKLG